MHEGWTAVEVESLCPWITCTADAREEHLSVSTSMVYIDLLFNCFIEHCISFAPVIM